MFYTYHTIEPQHCASIMMMGLRDGGLLLNTGAEQFNSMVIGWGHPGVIWGLNTFVVYVRDSRYTKELLDRCGEFTISAPIEGRLKPEVLRVCGTLSGRDVNKAEAAGLTLIEPHVVRTSAIAEYPLTLECKVLYSQRQVLESLPEELRERYYSRGRDLGNAHTAYIGEIVDAYVLTAR